MKNGGRFPPFFVYRAVTHDFDAIDRAGAKTLQAPA